MSKSDLNNDVILLDRLKNGDESALTELYNKFWEPLFISSYNVLKDKELCEDVIQDVFLNIWNKHDKLEIHISLKSYLYACVRYEVFNQLRKNKEKIHLDFFDNLNERFQYNTPETELMHNELVHQINSIVEMLPEKCRQVYKMSRDEQLSHKEIAQTLNISTKTVENHITKALYHIRLSIGSSASMAMVLWLYKNLMK